jgi:hypothetical protein
MSDLDPQPEVEEIDDAPRGRLVSLRAVLAALGVVALVAALTLALQQRSRADDLDRDAADRHAVATAAARFGEVYLSYDFASSDGSGGAVLDLVTPKFAAEFKANRAPGIEELFTNLGTSTTATTDEVFVGDVSGDHARALVVVDVVAKSDASGTQTLTGLSFVVELSRTDDGWLVDEVLPPPQPDLAGDGADGSTTTAPGAPTTTATTAP